MTLIEAIVLGIVQGATEFLPVSSSGHLVLVPALLGIAAPSLNVLAITHQGTLLAILVYFRRDLWAIVAGVLAALRRGQPMGTSDARLGWFIAVGSIPAAVGGLLLEERFDDWFSHPATAAAFLLITAALLVAGERLLTGRKELERMNWLDAIVVGLAQMLALLPGVSRSGSTITAGLMRGLDRPTAARYSFLLGVPAIFGAGLLALIDLAAAPDLAAQAPELLATFVASAVVGYACIHFLLTWLRSRSLIPFAIYCAVFGILFLLGTAVT